MILLSSDLELPKSVATQPVRYRNLGERLEIGSGGMGTSEMICAYTNASRLLDILRQAVPDCASRRPLAPVSRNLVMRRNSTFWDGRSAAFGPSAVVPFCFAERLPMPLCRPLRG